MNDDQIEKLLQKAPRPSVPPGLLERLQADVSLPGSRVREARSNLATPWFKRWIPAFSFASILLGCAVLVAQQSATVIQLKKANETLADETRDLGALRRQSQQLKQLRLDQQELERLRKENLEVQNLRLEVVQLRDQASRLAGILAENQKLVAELASRPVAGGDGEIGPALEVARAKAESIKCVNNLKQIGLAARIFATDNQDLFPSDFLSMKNELSTPKILHCPSDVAKPEASDWTQFGPGNGSYEFLSPGLKNPDPSVVLARCTIHGHVCMADGSVQQNPEKYGGQIVIKDGKHVLVRPAPQSAPRPQFE